MWSPKSKTSQVLYEDLRSCEQIKETRNTLIGVPDSHRSQEILQMEEANDQPGSFHAKLLYLKEKLYGLQVNDSTNSALGLGNHKKVGIKTQKPLLCRYRDNDPHSKQLLFHSLHVPQALPEEGRMEIEEGSGTEEG